MLIKDLSCSLLIPGTVLVSKDSKMVNTDGMVRVLVLTVFPVSAVANPLRLATKCSKHLKGGRSTEFPSFSPMLGSRANLAYKLHIPAPRMDIILTLTGSIFQMQTRSMKSLIICLQGRLKDLFYQFSSKILIVSSKFYSHKDRDHKCVELDKCLPSQGD